MSKLIVKFFSNLATLFFSKNLFFLLNQYHFTIELYIVIIKTIQSKNMNKLKCYIFLTKFLSFLAYCKTQFRLKVFLQSFTYMELVFDHNNNESFILN